MIAALLMAIAPQWFTSANPLEGIPGAQRPAAGALLAGYRPAGARPVDAGGLRRGAFPVGGADRHRHRPGGYHPWHSPGRWPDAWNPPSCACSMSCWPSLLLLQLTVIILLGFGTVNAAVAVGVAAIASFAPGASRSGARAPQRLRRGGPGQRRHFFAVFWRHILPNSLTAVLAFATLQFGQAMLAPPPSASSATALRRRSRSGDY